MNFGKWFLPEEFACSHTGKIMMEQSVLDGLNELREKWGKPIILSSAYRHETHPVEASKIAKGGNAGQHSKGTAVDILCAGQDAYNLLNLIIEQKIWSGVGISQRGYMASRFIHIDQSKESNRPTIWSY
tara:strand:+ start:110 stop:496 length:387 start_codon:yes stop_codon:yes gene_type:complete